MNKAVVGAVALAVVAGGGVAVASWSGSKVTGELKAQADELAKFPGVKVVENSVSKGLLSSTQTVTLEFGCDPAAAVAAVVPAADAATPADDAASAAAGAPADGAEADAPSKPLRISWRNQVSHGPLPGFRSVGVATIDSELVFAPETAAKLAEVFGKAPPLTARTTLGFGGNYVSDIVSPAFKYSQAGKGDMEWQGLQATVRGNVNGGIKAGATYSMEAPGFHINMATEGQPAGTLRVGKMVMKGEVMPNDLGTLWVAPSKGTLSLASLELSMAKTDQPGSKPVQILFDNVEGSSDATIENGLLTAVSKLSTKGRVDDFPIDKVEMQVSLKRLHAVTYEQLMRNVMSTATCQKPGDEEAQAKAAMASAEALQKGLTALLVHNPEYSLDRLAVEFGGKTAELSYSLGTKGVTEADAALPLPVVLGTKAQGAASFKVQTGWIEHVVKKAASLQAAEGGASVETTSAAMMSMIQAGVDDMVAKGFMAREGDVIRSKAVFEGGMLKVNDQPLDFPIGAMLAR